MKAVRYQGAGGVEVVAVIEEAAPEPGVGEVQIAVAAAGINRADLSQREGHYPPPFGTTDIPGLEVSGTIAALGAGVTEFAVGDRVCALLAGGGYAETVVVPASLVLVVPDRFDLVDAAALPEAIATVYSTVHRAARLAPGDTVLIHGGAGGIGTMAIQLAHARGARVLTTASGTDRIAFLESLGADAVIDYRTEDFVERVYALTDGAGADIVLDIVGAAYLDRNLSALATGGRLVVIGSQGGERTATLDVGRLMAKRQSIIALTLRARPLEEKADIMRGVRDEIWPLVAEGRVRAIIDERFPLEKAAAAQAAMELGHIGKILLTTSVLESAAV